MITKRFLSLCALGLTSTLLAHSTLAGDFYGIVDSFGKKPRNAYLDVAVDASSGGGGSPDVLFDVYDNFGTQIAEFTVTTQNGFASSSSFGNIFNLAGAQPLPTLVRARTASLALDSGAVLHIDSLGAPMAIGLLNTRKVDDSALGMGTVFALPLGSFRSATLLIANVSGGDVGVDIFKGTKGASGLGNPTNPRLQNCAIWKVNLTQNEAFSNVIVTSTNFTVVQAVIDDGRSIQSFQVLPSQ